MPKITKHVRAYPDTNIKIQDLSRELSLAQRGKVSSPEVLRRTFNIPKLKDILLEDAKVKGRKTGYV